MARVKTAGWLVLLLVFVDEVLALVALGFWGRHLDPGWLWVWVLPLAGTLVWYLFASPKARWGHPVGRPAAKLLVFGVAAYGLWDLDHPAIALAFPGLLGRGQRARPGPGDRRAAR